jgi:hypothetical protein
MFERFDADARRGVVLAQELARDRGEDVTPAHLMLGAARVGALADLPLDAELAITELEEVMGPGGDPTGETPRFTRDGKKAMELALRQALSVGSNVIHAEHLALGITRSTWRWGSSGCTTPS